jgi:hypothetical protein
MKLKRKHQEKDHKEDGKNRSGKMSQRRKNEEERKQQQQQQQLQEDERKTDGSVARWAT